ncbi:MAG: bifunctional folylpolyglutamate synthase/dihydrofolate synthase, partial [Calditrichaeota bacterium]
MQKHSYDAAEKFILSREFFGMKLGLDNIREFLENIGAPQKKYKTIHIAGTNGKGSTASMFASVLQKQGYKTGLFTSPHLVTLRERASVNGRIIPKSSVVRFIDKYRKILAERKLSFFELTTAMALDHFAHSKVDIAVIETGLGGRLDATNVLNPILTITTDISKDHMEILGSTIPKIAKEKAGIIKPNTDHLIGMLPEKAAVVIKKRCKELHAPLHQIRKKDFNFEWEKLSITSNLDNLKFHSLSPSLVGTHQLKNSALVLKGCQILKENGLKITKKAVKDGIENTVWRARFQIVQKANKPLHIFDVRHNFKGVESFVKSVQLKFPGKKAYVITGFVKRKEHQKIFHLLAKISLQYNIVPLSTKRSTDINELIRSIDFKNVPVKKYGRLETAYKSVVKTSSNADIIIVIGSHY